jgi:hypothetical protein
LFAEDGHSLDDNHVRQEAIGHKDAKTRGIDSCLPARPVSCGYLNDRDRSDQIIPLNHEGRINEVKIRKCSVENAEKIVF